MQQIGTIDSTLMVTPWNLTRIRDLGRHYLAEARRYLLLMEQATSAHSRELDEDKKQGHREYSVHCHSMARHAYTIASQLCFGRTTLGKQAAFVKLVRRYETSGREPESAVGQLYQRAASQLRVLLRPASEKERSFTLLVVQAMQQAQLHRKGRSRKPCGQCREQKYALFCKRGHTLKNMMNKQERSAQQMLANLPSVADISQAQLEHFASACAGYITAALCWHRHCFGSAHGGTND